MTMTITIRKWGNSLGFRLPGLIAKQAGLNEGSKVSVQIIDNNVVVVPIKDTDYKLDELLEKINDKNIHKEIDAYYSIGNETW